MNDYLLYIGKGASILGIPARNLSKDEAELYGEKRLIRTGLYELSKEAKIENVEIRKNKKSIKSFRNFSP